MRAVGEGFQLHTADLGQLGRFGSSQMRHVALRGLSQIVQMVSNAQRSRAPIQRLADETLERVGDVDILVNNAAWVRYQSIPEIAPETVDRMLDVGFKVRVADRPRHTVRML